MNTNDGMRSGARKRNMHLLFVCLVIVFGSMAFVGCGKKPQPVEQPSIDVSAEVETEEVDPFAEYPFEVKGVTLVEKPEKVNDVAIVAELAPALETRDGYMYIRNWYDMGDGNMVFSYIIADEAPSEYYADGEYCDAEMVPDCQAKAYLTAINAGNKIVETMELPGPDSIEAVQQVGSQMILWTDPENSGNVQIYNSSLHQVDEILLGPNSQGQFGPNCRYYYYLDNGQAFCTELETGITTRIEFQNMFSADYMQGVFCDGQSDYGLLTGTAGDLNDYEALVNLETGEFLYFSPLASNDVYVYVDNHALVSTGSSKIPNSNLKVICNGGDTFSYNYESDENSYMSAYPMLDGRVLFCLENYEENTPLHVECWLYDSRSGMLIGKTTFDAKSPYQYMNRPPISRDNGSILFCLEGEDFGNTIYNWQPNINNSNGMEDMTVEPSGFADFMQLAADQINARWDPNAFVPGEVKPELADLKERANELGEKLGVNIYISDECRCVVGGYAIEPSNNRAYIEHALDVIEYEASKYPENFISQIKWDWIDGIDIYLSDMMIGLTDQELGSANGLVTYGDNRLIMAIAINDAVDTTFHHEMSHCIDRKIQADFEYTALDDVEWEKLNPSDFAYLYSYSDAFSDDMVKYVYGQASSQDVYFIDCYAQTSPTEDRSRLMEQIMCDDSWIDWSSCPNMQKKLVYYAKCIRESFDTTGWDAMELRWEQFGKQ